MPPTDGLAVGMEELVGFLLGFKVCTEDRFIVGVGVEGVFVGEYV